MSLFVSELPGMTIKPGNMTATVKLKVLLALLALLLYVYILMYIKTLYLKSKRLDHIMDMVLDTEKQLLNVHNMDQRLAAGISQVERVDEDY